MKISSCTFQANCVLLYIRISEVKMQKTDANQTARAAHRQVKSSTTLNRRYVKRPTRGVDMTVPVKRSPKVSRFSSTSMSANRNASKSMSARSISSITKAPSEMDALEAVKLHPIQKVANERVKARIANTKPASSSSTMISKMTAKELKDQAIQKALASASSTTSEEKTKSKKNASKKGIKMHFGMGRVILAFSCAAVAVFAIVYFVNLNMPDISLRVAAMQTGIEASYPTYVPRDYSLTDITSEEGMITLNFRNANTGESFSLIEEKSSWDSNALQSNYVKNEFANDYTTIREQGLTIFIDNNRAAWVNGGVVYKLTAPNGVLTKKQIKTIATSL